MLTFYTYKVSGDTAGTFTESLQRKKTWDSIRLSVWGGGSKKEWGLGKREKVQEEDSIEWQKRKKQQEKDRQVELNPRDQVGGI